ncbi:MAG: glutamyl-tRNA reductase [Acidimicrobiales bacterium]
MTVLPGRLPKALHDLRAREHLGEVVVLSTCMRTEIYAVAPRFHPAIHDIRNFLSDWSGAPPEEFVGHLYEFYEEVAVRHLFRVAAGMDSAVLGEGEVLGQVRDAWEAARIEGAAGPALSMLFRHALAAGKRVRTETAIARGTTSLSHAAVAMASERMGTLSGRATLVVGAGGMGEAMTEILAARPAAGEVLVANRTWSKAVSLAERFGGRAVAWEALPDALAKADVVLTSTGSSELVLEVDDVRSALATRPVKPLLIIDVAVPRDVDPAVAGVEGVTLLDMDALKSYAEASMATRRQELPLAERIVGEEVERYFGQSVERQVAPLVSELRERAEQMRLGELARHQSRLASLDDQEARAVDALTRGIVAKLLHDPTVQLKVAAGTPTGEELAQALRQLFDL